MHIAHEKDKQKGTPFTVGFGLKMLRDLVSSRNRESRKMKAKMLSNYAGILILSWCAALISPVSGHSLTYVLPDPGVTEIWGEDAGVSSGAALAEGDVNGDGYADIVIGAPFASPLGRDKAGAVYVILGGESFPPTNPVDLGAGEVSMVIYGAATGDLLGGSLAVGDVNGNGIDDIIIGGPGVDTPGTDPAGVAYVVFGSQSLTSSLDFASTPADVTIVGEQRRWDYNLGIAIASGDVDGDNIKDIILGFRGANTSAGKVYLVLGQPTLGGTIYLSSSADQKIYGAEGKSYLGDCLASGDINGDTYDDVIIGAWGADKASGRVYVIFGTPSFPAYLDLNVTPADITIDGDNAQDYFGSSLASGDLNGDGIDDLAAGAWGADAPGNVASGKVYIFYGSNTFTTPLTIDLNTANADAAIDGPSTGGFLGYALATGDVNGDGMTDLLIGAYGTDMNAGRVYVIHGKVPLNPTFDTEISGENAYDKSGSALASGDLNGDDIDDIVLGALEADPSGRNEAGSTYVILGTKPAAAARVTAEDHRTSAEMTLEDTGTGTSAAGSCFVDTAALGSNAGPDAQSTVGLRHMVRSLLTGLFIVGLILCAPRVIRGRLLNGGRSWKRKVQAMGHRIAKFSATVLFLTGTLLIVSAQTAEAVPQDHHGGTEGCRRCHLTHGRRAEIEPGVYNLYSIQGTIATPSSGNKDVKFLNTSGANSYADAGSPFDGICEVCHTQTKYFKNDTWDDPTGCDTVAHKSTYASQDCMPCHDHEDAFVHGGGDACDLCHGTGAGNGTNVSHATHVEDASNERGLGIQLNCNHCHDTDSYPCFSGSKNLADTQTCNTCHSPGGGFDGVENGSYGAKAVWATGSAGTTDKWCVGCHDSDPPNIQSKTAPDIGGNDDPADGPSGGYGYYVGALGIANGVGAHANGTYGVLRSATSTATRGECVHCHDHEVDETAQHGELFAASNPSSQTDNFCFQCHKGSGSVQAGGITNNNYAANFGGGTPVFTNIKDAFDPSNASSHNLSDVLAHAIKVGPALYDADTNACFVCHDVHYAERNSPVTITSSGVGIKTAIRLPGLIGMVPPDLFGDEGGSGERMSDYVPNNYQAPYYSGGTNFEPADNSTSDGSNLPNYKKFCLTNCHDWDNAAYAVESSEHGTLTKIEWDRQYHGEKHGNSGVGSRLAPWTDTGVNYVLSCLDCHEPHGSENEFLLRGTVNGVDVSVPGPSQWLDFCSACHTISQHYAPWDSTTDCSAGGICHRHDTGNYF